MRRNGDLIASLALALFGGYVILAARDLPYTSEFGPGPGFFPLWIGIGILGCSLFMVFIRFSHPVDSAADAEDLTVGMGRALAAWSAFVISLMILPRAGFVLSIALLTAFLITVLERRSPWLAFGVGLGLALGFHVIFVVALGVSLPVGPWGF
jgi:putative tricarboxylic transport membrane protein